LLECAADASERELPVEFHVVGFTDRDEQLLATGKVSITGPYEQEDLPKLLRRANCQIAWIPSIWPETFCYTLSETIQGGLYPVAFDIGAVAERMRALDWGELLPLGTPASDVNDCFLDLKPPLFPAESAEKNCRTSYDRYLRDYYEDLAL
jgi:glycosyltransferase involved in cell wall biosynthesis